MPRTLTPQQFSSKYQTSNDPTQSLGVDPTKFLQSFPDITPDIFSGVTYFIGLLDKAMGWTIPTTTSQNGIPTALSSAYSLLEGFNLTGPNSFWTQINTGPLAQDLQSLGTLINEQLGGTASTVNVFVTDSGQVRELAADGVQSTDNTISVVNPVGIAFDSSDVMYVTDSGTASVIAVTLNAVQTTLGFTGLVDPVDVAVDGLGTVYVADHAGAVYKLTASGVQTQLNFTGLQTPTSISVDNLGDVYVADSGAAKVYKMTAGGTQSTLGFTGLIAPQGVLVDSFYDVYVSDNTSVYRLTVLGSQTTMGFTGLTAPKHMDMDSAGALYVADGGSVFRLSTTGSQSSVGYLGTAPVGVAVQNAAWADIEKALQQIQSSSNQQWDQLLSELGLSSVTGSGSNSFATFVSTLQSDWNGLLDDLGLGQVSGSGNDTLSTYLSEMESWWDGLFTHTSTTSGTSLASFLNTLLGPTSQLNSSNLFGSIAPSLLSSVPVASIGVGTPNFLANPGFDTAASVVDQGNQGWVFNGSVGHTNVGCAEIAASGVWKTLESNATPVSTGETMPMSIWAQYVGATSTASGSNDIQLNARAYQADAGGTLHLVSTTLLQAIQSPSGSSSAPSQNNFQQLAGTYTVPAGVDHVSMQLAVSPNVTAGTVRFDDGVLSVSGLMPQNLVQNLTSDLGNIFGSFAPGGTSAQFATGVSNFLALFGISSSAISTSSSTSFWTNIVNDIVNPLNAIEAQVNNVIVGASNSLQDVFNSIFGTGSNPVTAKVQAASVSNVFGGSTLQSDLNSLLTGLYGGLQGTGSASPLGVNTLLNNFFGSGGSWLTNLANLFGPGTTAPGTTLISNAVPNISAGIGNGQSSDLLSWLNATSGATGSVSNTALDAANKGIGLLANTVQGLSAKVQNQLTGAVGAAQSGQAYQVYFGTYPAGAFSAAPFNVTYGPISGYSTYGTGYLSLANGDAVWNKVNNGDVSCVGIYCPAYILTFTGTPTSFTLTYNGHTTSSITYSTATASGIQTALQALSNMPANGVQVTALTTGGYLVTFSPVAVAAFSVTPTGGGATGSIVNSGHTDTDYQELQASIAGLPSGPGAVNFAVLRSNAAGTTYVYGAVYLSSSYTLNWILGSVISGVNHVWASGTNAPLDFNFTFVAGVGTNTNRYQGISGDTVVFDWTNTSSDSGGVFPVGTGQRYWGFRSDTFNGGQNAPAPASYVGCADNAPPSLVGSGFRQYSSSGTTPMTYSSGAVLYFPTGFFDTTTEATSDWSFNSLPSFPGVVAATVQNKGWYQIDVRCQMSMSSSAASTSISVGVQRYNSAGTLLETMLLPGVGYSYNLDTLQGYTSHFGGNGGIYMQAGDSIVPYYWLDGPGPCSGLSFIGDAAGAQTWWAMRLANWSLN